MFVSLTVTDALCGWMVTCVRMSPTLCLVLIVEVDATRAGGVRAMFLMHLGYPRRELPAVSQTDALTWRLLDTTIIAFCRQGVVRVTGKLQDFSRLTPSRGKKLSRRRDMRRI